jgi:hypothetical protein
MSLKGIPVVGELPVILPESGSTTGVEIGYLSLKILPLSEEERKRYWNKTVVEFEGEVTLAELVIRKLAERQGFDAVWVTGANKFTKVWPRVPEVLPPVSQHWYEHIASSATALNQRVFGRDSKGGCWDIIGCRHNEVLFIESKRRGKDAINNYQRGWFEAVLKEGVPLSSFLIVEWG